MFSVLRTSIRWHLALGKRFMLTALVPTACVVVLTLLSQIAKLLASFLPLKVIILLGSEGIPRYFPASFAEIDHDLLVLVLSVCTVSFFIFYLVAEKLIDICTALGTGRLLAKNNKMVLFENQNEVAANAYKRYSRALAGCVFVLFSLVGMLLFYPSMAVVLLVYSILAGCVLGTLYKQSLAAREKLEKEFSPLLKVIGGVGFFFAFAYMVTDFITGESPSVVIAIVFLLLSRQVMNRLADSVASLVTLQRHRIKLDALFFQGKVLLPTKVKINKTFWPLLYPGAREEWIKIVLDELVSNSGGSIKCEWLSAELTGVVCLIVKKGNKKYLLKFYEANRSSLAQHEVNLMGENLKGIPACVFVGSTQVEKYHCLLYKLPRGRLCRSDEAKQMFYKIQLNLFSVKLSSSLLSAYKRSRPTLVQRLEHLNLEKAIVAKKTDSDISSLTELVSNIDKIKSILKSLPVVLVNPCIMPSMIWVDESGEPLCLYWERWRIEPVGASWAEPFLQLSGLEEVILKVAKRREQLRRVNPRKAELAALACQLEKEMLRQRFTLVLDLIVDINKKLLEATLINHEKDTLS